MKSQRTHAPLADAPPVSNANDEPLMTMVVERLCGSVRAVESLRGCAGQLAATCAAVVQRLRDGATLYTCGNGGSAAQALHLAEELIGRYRGHRPPLRAICLNADPTALTCIANDFGFDQAFARQCQALLRRGDLLVAFSTSGNSANIVAALQAARANQAITIGLLGRDGGQCLALCDHHVLVPETDSAFIQDAHQVALHVICEAVERATAGR